MLVSQITPEQKKPLADWHGKLTNGSSPMPSLGPNTLREKLLKEVLPHADAHLIRTLSSAEAEDFMTPPRPHEEQVEDDYPELPTFPKVEQSAAIEEARQALSQYDPQELDEETVHTAAAAFDVDPQQLHDSPIPKVPLERSPRSKIAIDNPESAALKKTIGTLGAPPGLELEPSRTEGNASSSLVAPCSKGPATPCSRGTLLHHGLPR